MATLATIYSILEAARRPAEPADRLPLEDPNSRPVDHLIVDERQWDGFVMKIRLPQAIWAAASSTADRAA
jgi:hypothetical protein